MISFQPLQEEHFPLLLKWLESPHVKAWWPADDPWTPNLIEKKYLSYTQGYKEEAGIRKPIQASVIYVDRVPVGYIQIYHAYDFPRSKSLTGLPENLGAFDLFIGEESYLRQGWGTQALCHRLKNFQGTYTHIFADPDFYNVGAIRTYEKAGFKEIAYHKDVQELWMIKIL